MDESTVLHDHGPMVVVVGSRPTFCLNPDTKTISVVFLSAWESVGVPVQIPMEILITPEKARMLLADLPKLESVLRQAIQDSTMPDSVQ